MAIMGFIVVVAGRAFSDSTSMRVRSQNMLNSAEEAGRVSAILKEDISQMGAKSWVASNGNFEMVEEVYIDFANKDYSSYILTRKTDIFDSIYFKKVHYNATSGACGGVMSVEWYVKPVSGDNVLYRKCSCASATKCPNSCNNNVCTTTQEVEIARNVSEFKLLPSRPGVQNSSSSTSNSSSNSNTMFPPENSNKAFNLVKEANGGTAVAFPNATGTRYTLCKFTPNPPSGTTTPPAHTNFYIAQYNQYVCQPFKFFPGEEYSIDFELPCIRPACASSENASKCYGITEEENFNPMSRFQPKSDHLSIGLRTKNNGPPISGIPDFLFYPPYDMNGQKAWHFEFSVPKTYNNAPLACIDATGACEACIGITGAFYSTAANGHLDIQNLTLSRKTDNVYHFNHSDPNYNPAASSASTTPNRASVKAFELTLGINKNRGKNQRDEITSAAIVIPTPNNGILPPGVI